MNMIAIPQNNMLFLKGIFFDDIQTIEDKMISNNLSFDASNTNSDQSSSEFKKRVNEKIPSKFYNKTQWFENTKNIKIKCWCCDSVFAGTPVFLPQYISNTPLGKVYETYGAFCGFGCAYLFLKTNHEFYEDNTFHDRLAMLKMLYFCIHEKKIDDFYPSPNKYKTELYGGDMSMADFKKELKRINQLNITNPFKNL